MQSDITSLRYTRAALVGGGLAFWILTVYGIVIEVGAVWVGCLAGIATICTWLVVEVTRVIGILGERWLP